MSDGASLRELSSSLASFTESQSQIKSIFSLYDHDSDGYLTTNQALLFNHIAMGCDFNLTNVQAIQLMRKLGFEMPREWGYVYRDAVTLPMVRAILTREIQDLSCAI
jgi:Ca2+-binding EF-hand superfamily protein